MMKKHISLIICFISVIALCSCKDWLDVKPSTQLDRIELFSTESGYTEALIGIYSEMSKESLYGRELTFGMIEVAGGAYNRRGYGTNYNIMDNYPYKRLNTSKNATVVGWIDNIWTQMYTIIANLNSILNTIDDNKGIFTGDNYALVKGEALGLHAFIHFELLRMYGNSYVVGKDNEAIPFMVDLATDVSPLLTVEQVLKLIIDELEEAAGLLGNDPMRLGTTPAATLASAPSGSSLASNNIYDWHNRRFHFNYYAAKATLARAYLWKGDKPAALQAALDVIQDQQERFPWAISGNVTGIGSTTSTNQDRTFATEHIFALNIRNLEEYMTGYLTEEGAGSPFMTILGSDRGFFEGSSDLRYNYLYTTLQGASVLTKFYQKVVSTVGIQPYFIKRMPLIRISEMYYIAAECATNATTGLEYLETVRRQRGLTSMAITDESALPAEIYKEYRKEFCGEGQMWFYYKRNNYTSIPNMSSFNNVDLYTFDRPENEDVYGNRE